MLQSNGENPLNQNDSMSYASGNKLAAYVSYLSTMLATILFVGAILVSYKASNNDLSLGLIDLFTIVFVGSVGLLTNASMEETFGATAASVILFNIQTAI